MKIGVSGYGFVGQAVARGFFDSGKHDVKVYDPYKERIDDFNVLLDCDVVFLCVPTLNKEGYIDTLAHRQDTKPLVDNLNKLREADYGGVVAIKSTVLPEIVQQLVELYESLNIVGNPEFLQQNDAYNDFINARVTIIGGKYQHCVQVAATYLESGMEAPIKFLDTAADAMFTKYIVNNFFAVKNAFFNEMKLIADANGLDFYTALSAALEDDRIHPLHTKVPGPDGHLGFGGACLPKDAIAMYSSSMSKMLDAALTVNAEVRPEE